MANHLNHYLCGSYTKMLNGSWSLASSVPLVRYRVNEQVRVVNGNLHKFKQVLASFFDDDENNIGRNVTFITFVEECLFEYCLHDEKLGFAIIDEASKYQHRLCTDNIQELFNMFENITTTTTDSTTSTIVKMGLIGGGGVALLYFLFAFFKKKIM